MRRLGRVCCRTTQCAGEELVIREKVMTPLFFLLSRTGNLGRAPRVCTCAFFSLRLYASNDWHCQPNGRIVGRWVTGRIGCCKGLRTPLHHLQTMRLHRRGSIATRPQSSKTMKGHDGNVLRAALALLCGLCCPYFAGTSQLQCFSRNCEQLVAGLILLFPQRLRGRVTHAFSLCSLLPHIFQKTC